MSTNPSPRSHGGRSHLLGMLVIGGVVVVALAAAGRSLGEAVPIAALLACPLMMIGMMFVMLRGSTAQKRSGAHDTTRDGHGSALDDEPATPGTYAPADPSRRP